MLLSLLAAGTALAQSPLDFSRQMSAIAIPGVIAEGTKTRLLRAGFKGTEGVVALPDGSVLFCELDADRVIRIDPADNFTTYLDDANRPTGLGYDSKGRLVAAQSREPRVATLAPERITLADSFEGQPLVRPNDLIIDRRGGIYFTDPIPNPQVQFREPPPGRKSLLFYLTPEGKLTKLTDAIGRPNGVQLSTDEKTLYAVDSDRIVAFRVRADGSLENPRTFVEITGDGLAVDSMDRLYVATEQGVQVVNASGQILGLIPTPVRMQSVAFAGVERRTLYAVGRGAVYRVELLAQGIKGRAK